MQEMGLTNGFESFSVHSLFSICFNIFVDIPLRKWPTFTLTQHCQARAQARIERMNERRQRFHEEQNEKREQRAELKKAVQALKVRTCNSCFVKKY